MIMEALHLGAAQPWTRQDSWETASLTIASLSLAVTIGGFTLAVLQLRRSATAQEESNKLLSSVQERLIGNDLLVMLPELHRLEDELSAAARTPSLETAERVLVRYARAAWEAAAVLDENSVPGSEKLVRLLRRSAEAATQAKSELYDESGRTLQATIAPAQSVIAKATGEGIDVTARLRRKVEEIS